MIPHKNRLKCDGSNERSECMFFVKGKLPINYPHYPFLSRAMNEQFTLSKFLISAQTLTNSEQSTVHTVKVYQTFQLYFQDFSSFFFYICLHLFYKNSKAAKGEGWALPFISCAQDTVGL